ncbi:MAG TPA: glycoside hydrolase family 2 TIM barrel-domain containing protein [Candidatus Bathyarchaeia archaeon]|nr:glycoside hydrolase family 2 TIM barrel-domain containing protein [Candidatus Bathyarchaeia archaeon]
MKKVIISAVILTVGMFPSFLHAQEQSNDIAPVAQQNVDAVEFSGAESIPVMDQAKDPATIVKSFNIPEDAISPDEYVRQAWALSAQGKLGELGELVDAMLAVYGPAAKALQATLTDFPKTTQINDFRILNAAGTMLFIQAEAFMNYGRTEEALAAFQSLIEEYPWAKAWDPRGWYWSVKEKSEASIAVITGKVVAEIEEHEPQRIKTFPKLAFPGTCTIVDFRKYGEFQEVGTSNYHYKVNDPRGLAQAVGEGIYPNTSSVYKNPGYRKAKDEGRLEGSHWDFVRTDDLEAAFYKWATAPEPWGVRLFYLGMIFEKAGMLPEALKAYHTIVVHFPQSIAWTNWNTPWYPAQAAIGKIKHIIRCHPELELEVKWMQIQIKNGYDNDVKNDEIVTYPGVIYKRTFWDMVKGRLTFLKKKVDLGEPVKVVGKGKVQLKQYANGHWQMLVEGNPYVIKGMTYVATKVGQSPDKGTLVSWMYEDTNKNGLADGPYDSWVDKNKNNVQDPDEPIVGDFQLMKEMGVNTIREYHQPFQPSKEVLRDMYEKYGIRVIMGDFLGKYTLGSGATWFEGTDYENPQHRKNMMDSVRRMVEEFKDEPYILLWLLGNENNYGVASNADKKPEAYYKFANEVAKMIKSLDPNHPVALCNGDTLYLDIFGKHTPDIDIYAANVYRGDYGFGAFWEQVRDAAGKPAFITEYGVPAYAKYLTLDEAEHLQANYHEGNWIDIESNIAGQPDSPGNALGGVIFQWMDEWWKNYEPFYHDTKSDAIGPFPGGYYYEEWFGLIGQGNGQHSPFLRQLRKSYFAYKRMWTGQ